MDFEEFSGLVHLSVRLGLIQKEAGIHLLDSVESKTSVIDPDLLVNQGLLTNWQLKKLIRHELEALTFANLDLLEPVSPGFLGRTYKARNKSTGAIVALKVLKKRFQGKEAYRYQFNRQAKIGMLLDHPKILKILDFFKGDTQTPPWLVSEWVQGGCLKEWLEHRSFLTCMEAIKILEQLAQSLEYVHKKGFTHGNISLNRILLDSTNDIRLSNFRQGLEPGGEGDEINWTRSKDYEGLELVTKSSPGDPVSDIFFTGCLFYQLLTGQTPLPESGAIRNSMYQSGNFRFIFNVEIEKTIPSPVLPLVKNMLTLDPKARYQSFTQVQTVIQVVRKNLGITFPEITSGKDKSTVFVVALDERKRNLLKSYFQNRGFRVLVSDELRNAVDSYSKKQYEHLVVEMESASLIRPEYMRLIQETEARRHKLNVILLPKKGGKVDLPSRPGTVILPPPQEFSAIYQLISPTNKS